MIRAGRITRQSFNSETVSLSRFSNTKMPFGSPKPAHHINWLDLFVTQNHERINQTINSLIACLRSGRRILEDCTAEILLVELGEILDAAVERVDGTNLLRIRGDRDRVALRGGGVHRAGHGLAIDAERLSPSSGSAGVVKGS